MGWYWLDKENRITPVSRYCDAGTEQDVIKAINTLKDLQKNKIVWVEEVEKLFAGLTKKTVSGGVWKGIKRPSAAGVKRPGWMHHQRR